MTRACDALSNLGGGKKTIATGLAQVARQGQPNSIDELVSPFYWPRKLLLVELELNSSPFPDCSIGMTTVSL